MRLTDLTAIGRTLDPRYPTNLAIILLILLVTLAAAGWRWLTGVPGLEAMLWGVQAGLAIFFAWALARELDPDHDLSAFVAVALALAALPGLGLPQLLPLFWMLVAARIVNRTVGLPARPLDSLAVAGLGLWLTWRDGWIYGLMTAAALFLDGWLQPRLRRHLLLAPIALLASIVLGALGGSAAAGGWDSAVLRGLYALAAMLFSLSIVTLKPATALGDQTGEPLHPRRVRAAQGLALLTALLAASLAGQEGMLAHLPLWAAMLGIALYELAGHVRAVLRSAPEGA